jgi:hypothetical protein
MLLYAHLTAVATTYPPQDDNEELTEGAKVKAVVLDIDKQRYIVDVSLQPELVSAALPAGSQPAKKGKRKSKAPEESEGPNVGDEVETTVELIKGSYLVVSIPSAKPGVQVGYVATKDFNTQHTDPFSKFLIQQKCKAIVKEVRPFSLHGAVFAVFLRLALPLPGPLIPQRPFAVAAVQDRKGGGEEEGYVRHFECTRLLKRYGLTIHSQLSDSTSVDITDLKPGSLVNAKITSVLPTQLNISLGSHIRGALVVTAT